MLQLFLKVPWYVYLILFVLAIVARKIYKKNKGIYKLRNPHILNFSERKFFENLTSVLDPAFYVCPKVRLSDIVTIDLDIKKDEFWSKFKKISQKHADFVVCKRTTFTPLLIIEFQKEGVKRSSDKFINRIFGDAGIPVLRITAQRFYDKNNLKQVIDEAMYEQGNQQDE